MLKTIPMRTKLSLLCFAAILVLNRLRKQNRRRLFSQGSHDLLSSLSKVLLITGFILALRYRNHTDHRNFDWVESAIETLGGTYLLSNLLHRHVQRLVNSFYQFMTPRYFKSANQLKCEQLSALVYDTNYAATRPPSLQHRLEDALTTLTKMIDIEDESASAYDKSKRGIQSHIDLIETLHTLCIAHPTPIATDKVDELQQLAQTLPAATQPGIKKFINTMIGYYNYRHPSYIPTYYLQGNTNEAKQFINNFGSICNIPVYYCNPAKLTLEQLCGTPAPDVVYYGSKEDFEVNFILNSLIKTVSKRPNHSANQIIVISNADHKIPIRLTNNYIDNLTTLAHEKTKPNRCFATFMSIFFKRQKPHYKRG